MTDGEKEARALLARVLECPDIHGRAANLGLRDSIQAFLDTDRPPKKVRELCPASGKTRFSFYVYPGGVQSGSFGVCELCHGVVTLIPEEAVLDVKQRGKRPLSTALVLNVHTMRDPRWDGQQMVGPEDVMAGTPESDYLPACHPGQDSGL